MPFGVGLCKTQIGVGCHIQIKGAPAGNPAFQIVPDLSDSINALPVGAAYTSTATDGVWVCTYAAAGQWTVTGPS